MKTRFASISKVLAFGLACGIAHIVSGQTPSLYPVDAAPNPIGNKVANQVGDIVTIVLNESKTTSTALNTTTSKESSTENAIGQFLFSAKASGFGTHNGELPGMKMDGKSGFKGGGTNSSTNALKDKFSVMVTDVLPNGNYVVSASRKRVQGGETEYIVFTGVLRRWDISAANTVDSSLVSQAHIEYISEGNLTDAQKKGWFDNVLGKINPF